MATIVINVSVDADEASPDALALHEALHEIAMTVSGLFISVDTVVTSSVLADDERLLVERTA